MTHSVKKLLFLLGVTVALSHTSQGQVAPPLLQNFDHAQGALPEGWRAVTGDWRIANGTLLADSLTSDAYITFGQPSWQNYEVEASVTFRKVRNPSRWVSILVRATPDGRTPWSQVPIRFDTTASNGVEFAVRTDKGWSVRQKAVARTACRLNKARRLRVVVRGARVDGYLDGQHVVGSEFCVDRTTGCVGLGASGCIAEFDNVRVRHLPPSTGPAVVEKMQCEVVAHRGFSAVAPENTLASIRQAIDVGASGCEFDVYGCLDGTVVLMHDKTVDRTTNGKGPVTQLSLKQLQQLDAGSWRDAKYSDERIPTLTQALQLLKGTGCQPVIEIKMEGISQRVVKTVRELDMVDAVAVIAFSQKVVSEIRTLEPRIACAWLCSQKLTGTPAEQADWLQTQARSCQAEMLDLNFKMLSPELIAELKQRDIGVWTWTVNEADIMKKLQEWGVDSITTDHPNLLSRKPR